MKCRYQSLKRDGLELARDKHTKTQNLADLETRLEEMQMLRFGQVIDLDELDRARENRAPMPHPTTTAAVDDDEVVVLHLPRTSSTSHRILGCFVADGIEEN